MVNLTDNDKVLVKRFEKKVQLLLENFKHSVNTSPVYQRTVKNLTWALNHPEKEIVLWSLLPMEQTVDSILEAENLINQ